MSVPGRVVLAVSMAALSLLCALGASAVIAGAAAGGHKRSQHSAHRACRPRHAHRHCRHDSSTATRRRHSHSGSGLADASHGASGPAGSGGAASSPPTTGSTAAPGASAGAGESRTTAPGGGGATAGAPSPAPETSPTGPSPTRVQVIAKEYSLTLSRAEVPAGKVIVEFDNGGEDPHNLHFTEPSEGTEAGAFPTSSPGTHTDLALELRPGSYTLFCSLPHHEEKGMKATLVVR
jgi:plastocyanin